MQDPLRRRAGRLPCVPARAAGAAGGPDGPVPDHALLRHLLFRLWADVVDYRGILLAEPGRSGWRLLRRRDARFSGVGLRRDRSPWLVALESRGFQRNR